MITNVSEFKLAETVLKQLCRTKGCNFVDMIISFDNQIENGLVIQKEPKNIAHTIYLIISEYIENSSKILGVELFSNSNEKSDFLIRLTNLLRSFIYRENNFHTPLSDISLGYLYNKPLIWLIMKDIICPVFNAKLNNIKTIYGFNPYIDISRYYKESEINDNYAFIFINEISNEPVLNAFLLVEAIKAHGLDPISTLKDLFESDLYDKFYGLLHLSFDNEDKSQEFITTLTTITGINLRDFLAKRALTEAVLKTAQASQRPENAMQWWYLGIIDALLEPVRGSDWTSHDGLEDKTVEFWNKVEKIKQAKIKNRKEPGITFNELLRLKSKEMVDSDIDRSLTLQSLLSSKRVW